MFGFKKDLQAKPNRLDSLLYNLLGWECDDAPLQQKVLSEPFSYSKGPHRMFCQTLMYLSESECAESPASLQNLHILSQPKWNQSTSFLNFSDWKESERWVVLTEKQWAADGDLPSTHAEMLKDEKYLGVIVLFLTSELHEAIQHRHEKHAFKCWTDVSRNVSSLTCKMSKKKAFK